LCAPDALIADDVRTWAKATHLILLLDYDGTLAPFHIDPARACPDDELRALLRALCELPMTEVHIVSGRARHTLADWFPDRRLRLHGDHGASERTSAGTWVPLRGGTRRGERLVVWAVSPDTPEKRGAHRALEVKVPGCPCRRGRACGPMAVVSNDVDIRGGSS
jgi:hypothetical protein